MARSALIIGIDDYPTSPLSGCVSDAERMHHLLSFHQDGRRNFDCRLLTSPRGSARKLGRAELREALQDFLARDADLAFLHFSGHGYIDEDLGGFLVTTDAERYDEGISMPQLLTLANKSTIRELVVSLDCCHSGAMGEPSNVPQDHVLLREGVALLTASGRNEVSLERDGGGVFTSLLCGALSGEAADLFGKVTVAGIYAHMDPHLGAWDQRPRLRANLRRLSAIRECKPAADLALVRKLPTYFPSAEYEYPLDPSYEPRAEPRDPRNEEVFGHLQLLARCHLLEPVSHLHMYDAAMESGTCRLTPAGRNCWHLAKRGRL